MLELSLSYLRKNKKQTLTMILGITLASILLFSLGILFSSFRQFLINEVDDFHVKIIGNLDDVAHDNMEFFKSKDNEYYIKYTNIYMTYQNTEKICANNKCDGVFYNNKLLSLYGIGDNNYLDLFKSLLFTLVFVLAFSVFFIIYNSFQISLNKKRHDISLMKAIGINNGQLYKVFLLEGVLCGLLGLITGFILSLILNFSIINLINNIFDEFFDGQMKLCLYGSFIFIPLFFMLLIILFSSFIPLFKIKKYKAMEIFRNNSYIDDEKISLNNFILGYALVNYKRNKRKYKSLIICVFILTILFNVFINITNYSLKILDEYIDIPHYDLKVITKISDYKKLNGLAKKLSASEKNIYRSCTKNTSISKKYYLNGYQKNTEVLITDLGGNEVINLVRDTLMGDKIKKVNYAIFKNLKEINLENGKLDNLTLTTKIPFGFENMLLEGRVIVNLDKDKFDDVCPVFEGNMVVKTDKKGLDGIVLNYGLENDFVYTNVKKAYELIINIVLIIKIFMFLCIFLVCLISVFTIFNIVSANINIRKREFASIKVLGLTNFNISLCLLFESFIIAFKGALYAFPFVLLISNSLYKNLGVYFKINMDIFNFKVFFVSFIMWFMIVFICMILSHIHLYKNSLIQNIKADNI